MPTPGFRTEKERADWYEEQYHKPCPRCAERELIAKREAEDERIRQVVRDEINRLRPQASV